jgi:hypothetical protein
MYPRSTYSIYSTLPIQHFDNLIRGCRTRALDAGTVAFVSKPFEEPSLVECISAALEGVAVISGSTERSGAACPRSGGDLS